MKVIPSKCYKCGAELYQGKTWGDNNYIYDTKGRYVCKGCYYKRKR